MVTVRHFSDGSETLTVQLRRVMPGSARRGLRQLHRRLCFRWATSRLARLAPSRLPDERTIRLLHYGFGNAEWAAAPAYLEAVARYSMETNGPVLECGSGVSTVVLGFYAGRRGFEVCSLEHSAEWAEKTTRALTRGRVRARVELVPIRDYGPFEWYDIESVRLPKSVSLVICDGPPGDIKGGRYGLLPLTAKQLAEDAVILLDDASRPGEMEVLRRWDQESGYRPEPDSSRRTFAVVRRFPIPAR